MTIRAHAKVNLCLRVLGRRPDGYHDLDGVMHALELADHIRLCPHDRLELRVYGSREGGPGARYEGAVTVPHGPDNLALKAAWALRRAAGLGDGALIHLEKHIPVAAGLAGGSADAAACLLGLNRLWGLNWPRSELMPLAAELGADVPFALLGGAARARGIGERLEPVRPLAGLPVVLIAQPFGAATGKVFEAYGDAPAGPEPDVPAMVRALAAGDVGGVAAQCINTLGAVTARRHPEVARAVADLREAGALAALVSGSGPTAYGLFDREAVARRALKGLKPQWPGALLTRLTAAGPGRDAGTGGLPR